jgi:hypothetical protein
VEHKLRAQIISVSLVVLALLSSLGLLGLYARDTAWSNDLQHRLDSLAEDTPKQAGRLEDEAYQLAAKLFSDPARQSRFQEEVEQLYSAARDKDFLIVYNTGGFGGTSLEVDPEWSSILEGIQAKLRQWGYTSLVVEHVRGEYTLPGFLGEVRDQLVSYSAKAPELAAKVALLLGYNRDLKVIITGRSFGAQYSDEVMEFLTSFSRAYSIQAGRYFWYRKPASPRTLIMDHNGEMPDTLSRGDILAILRANLTHLPRVARPEGGSMKIGPYFFRAPGHVYTWDYPGVREQVTAFLKRHFTSPEG